MTDDDLKQKAMDMFTRDEEEVLSNVMERIDGWFFVTDGSIHIDESIHDLDMGSQYLTYLLAAYVAEFIDERETAYVEHSEVNEYYGWDRDSGRSAKDYASDYSNLLNTEEGAKAIAPAKLGEAVSKVENKLES